MTDSINEKVLANDRQAPTPAAQNNWLGARSSRYGDAYVQNLPGERAALALEGTYFLAHNATNDASTTLAGHPAPVLADADATMTKPFIHLIMPASATSYAFLDFLEIEVVTAGANGTQSCWAAQLDTGATRVSSAGTALTTVNPNMRSAASPALVPTGGVVTVGAESSQCRVLGFGTWRPSIEIAGDKYLVYFGRNARPGEGIATISHHVVDLGPVILGATDQFLFALHGQASQNAAGVYKVRLGWWER